MTSTFWGNKTAAKQASTKSKATASPSLRQALLWMMRLEAVRKFTPTMFLCPGNSIKEKLARHESLPALRLIIRDTGETVSEGGFGGVNAAHAVDSGAGWSRGGA